MSYIVLNAAILRKVGTQIRKSLMMHLANRASDDGTGIWPSKSRLAMQMECDVRTVQRVMAEFLAEGLIVETGRRRCRTGYTTEYAIDLDALERLPLVDPSMAEEAPEQVQDTDAQADFEHRHTAVPCVRQAPAQMHKVRSWATPSTGRGPGKPSLEPSMKISAGARREPPPAQNRWQSAKKKTSGGWQRQVSSAQTASRDGEPSPTRNPQAWCEWRNARLDRHDVSWIVDSDGKPTCVVKPERRAA